MLPPLARQIWQFKTLLIQESRRLNFLLGASLLPAIRARFRIMAFAPTPSP